jgi:hypothetical protein
MRTILLAALNLTVITVGVGLTLGLCIFLGYTFPLLWFPPVIGLVLGLAVTGVGVFKVRKKTRQASIEYEATRWLASRSNQNHRSFRGKLRTRIQQCLLWLPSVFATFVFCFYPIASHIVHPNSRYLTHYRVPIPLTWTIFRSSRYSNGWSFVEALISNEGSGQFGVTPFLRKDPTLSAASFGSVGRTSEDELSYFERSREQASDVSRLELKAGNVSLTCWQYSPQSRRRWLGSPSFNHDVWEVNCFTPANVGERDFYASFLGQKNDLPAFYRVLAQVTSTD